ncbi:hypothetical protein [Streptomyces syringium]|uniref:hypothetical protein n=1 Tax=Streptomyces syringium TaxID=76729 RepID=UPI0033B2147E
MPDQDDPRLYRTNSPHIILEIVDPETGRPIAEPGRIGRIVATNLLRRLMPVIRYPVGDLAEWADPRRGRLRLLGRSSDHARVGTAKISFVVLDSRLTEVMDSKEPPLMQIVLRRHHAKDELLVRVAAQVDDPAAAPARCTSACRAATLPTATTSQETDPPRGGGMDDRRPAAAQPPHQQGRAGHR